MNLKEPRQAPQASIPITPLCACIHSRMISDRVSEEDYKAGKVRCVECGTVIPDPYLQWEAKRT